MLLNQAQKIVHCSSRSHVCLSESSSKLNITFRDIFFQEDFTISPYFSHTIPIPYLIFLPADLPVSEHISQVLDSGKFSQETDKVTAMLSILFNRKHWRF